MHESEQIPTSQGTADNKQVTTHEQTVENTTQQTGRIVIVTGDKGGVGKSTFARGLLHLYINRQLKYLAYDSDHRNAQLYRHYDSVAPGVKLLDIFTRGGADDLLIDLEKELPPLVLVDLPAQSGLFFENFEKDLGVFDAVKGLGYRVTMVSVLSRVKDSVNILRILHKYCGDRVDYVVVKNLFHGEADKFERYDSSDTRTTLLADGAVEIKMPDLFFKPYDYIDEKNLTFSEVLEDKEANIVIKSRVSAWLKEFEQTVLGANELLGIVENAVVTEQAA
ncbi:CobQ/CobB/MinD/ParA nucleotide binding domain-containing protein (plasmid) [Cylindrospermum stagnale PCC 7417]|uniref:CobQ/CobB/MinD/ParA nucleotide binding domain-containing protein n=1 Tax=Cylindrospermum stagnale PCC 7417 TaxID=56107 RepID=K9X7Q7_9NOST|nr:AAA family ATPase [Cylindrospermum stagnale]AFZ28523.1 CobQ/CobB/MinD/ParA nucleotide binding domain-containing protein [Cylindrospermum stagnale PCC 7417]